MKQKAILSLICLALFSFTQPSTNYLEDKTTGAKVMFFGMDIKAIEVTVNGEKMTNNIVKEGDKIKIKLRNVTGLIPNSGTKVIVPGEEIIVIDSKNKEVVHSGNLLEGKSVDVKDMEEVYFSAALTIQSQLANDTYKFQAKFWDTNGSGVAITEITFTKK
ncbi:MAG TPA: hypothetical protein VF411_02510 [Bacteroidia bacterium]